MKLRSIIIVPLVLAVIGMASVYPQGNFKEKESLILHAVLQYLENLHFSPQDLDDDFSKQVFKDYINSLDSRQRFFTKNDISKLAQYETQLDDQIKAKTFEFFDLSIEMINENIEKSKTIFEEVMEYPFDLDKAESIELDTDKRPFAKDELELRDYWRKSIQYELIGKIESKMDAQKDSTEQMSFEEIKVEALEEIEENYTDYYKRLAKVRRSDRFENYINSITHIFDPHSDYYNPKEKEDFDIRMGGKLEGIGARLSTDGDYTKVVSIVPGGPAWKGKELEVDDLITAVTQEDGEPLNISGMRIDDVVQNIRGDKGTKVTLTVKKPDGTIADIEILRDEVILDEGFARSLILDMEGDAENIGYIKLPKFYSTFEGKDGNSCASDVAKEIEKLNKENVSGIILDLRNNGGGSLKDVITMSGLFIEDGPIVQVKPRAENAYVYEDEDHGVLYTGPLIVMVNQFSASASEILAAALQDYDRAMIVGSNSTFGKGTVQRFADLDRAVQGQNDLKPLGQLKITMQKFYRIDGGSTQLKGVNPDIILPDAYQYVDVGEKEYDHSLKWSEINAVEYQQDVYSLGAKSDIISKSQERVATSEVFNKISENAVRIKEARETTSYPIDYASFDKIMDQREAEADEFDNLLDVELESFVAKNLDVDMDYIALDESRVARNDDWLEGVKKDVYLEEVLLIMRDMQSYTDIKH